MAEKGGRSAAANRVAVVDIGSNSVRLVVFDRPSRSPLPVFNEKVLCGLGRGLGESGRLAPEGIELAHRTLERFVRLARAMRARRIDMLATAAVRDASNGRDFAAEVERRCGVAVCVLSGGQEARYSALGVLCGIPGADGIMGDLGGGSLELVRLVKGRVGRQVTLPLGPLRLGDKATSDRNSLRAEIDSELAGVDWLAEGKGLTFYPVGGAWRTLARIHMEQTGYPLHVIHQYRIDRRRADGLLQVVGNLGKRSLAAMPGVSRRCADILPFAALLLGRILRQAKPESVEFSAFGLREGYLFSRLGAKERERHPLIAGALGWAEDRFGALGAALDSWVAPLFPEDGAHDRLLRLATCHLSDIAWREHPDYRARHGFERVLHLPISGLGHADRVFAAVAVSARYGGSRDEPEVRSVLRLLADGERESRAVVLGLALRLAYSLSGGAADILKRTRLDAGSAALTLRLPRDAEVMYGEVVQRRLEALGRASGIPIATAVG